MIQFTIYLRTVCIYESLFWKHKCNKCLTLIALRYVTLRAVNKPEYMWYFNCNIRYANFNSRRVYCTL